MVSQWKQATTDLPYATMAMLDRFVPNDSTLGPWETRAWATATSQPLRWAGDFT
jgi:hypothetical protein